MTVTTYAKADERGVPSLVWRAGQNRRLEMIAAAARPERLTANSRVLVDGCGVGMYVRALRQFTSHVFGLDIELERVLDSSAYSPLVHVAAGEYLPYPNNYFDLILSHEVIEHVQNDALVVAEMVRVLKPAGRAIIFCPNRLYPFETHGHYWRGQYHFGNTPLINYLPDPWRNKLAPHVRAYTSSRLRQLFKALPVRIISHTQIYPGYDNILARRPWLGRMLRSITYSLEQTPLQRLGLSHQLVVEKM
ncbi:MAG TPA: methyltransferase domain-containing protein [Anaerolineae bacterium]|nr:methyltransferase domain-containing protein [Anaerolineae bacterium]HMR63094.1 methyltransferase domain-containing protein [Anaerolineae bacterium]